MTEKRAKVFEKQNCATTIKMINDINTFLESRVSDETSNLVVYKLDSIEELPSMIVVYYYGFN